MAVLKNIGLLARCSDSGTQADIHLIPSAAMAWDNGRINWVGPEAELPAELATQPQLNAGGKLVIPGLIDCHTHLAFAGWRADEFAERLGGKSYADIAKRGGGILSTVKATRAASHQDLLQRCRKFLSEMTALGITTVECKSGYGLDLDTELKILRVYRELSATQPLTIVPTFLGAHSIPEEFKKNRAAYIKLLTKDLIPTIAKEKLAAFCDVFMETIAFSADETREIFECGRHHGLGLKLHADQLSNGGGAELAASFLAASADHLEHISDAGIEALKASGTVAVLLPLASLSANEQALNAHKLRAAGVRIAVATDFNPGTAPSYHLPFALSLACLLHRLTPAEALKGATINAARAVALESEIGSLDVGKKADFAIIDAPDVNHWLYHIRANACVAVYKNGIQLKQHETV